MLSARSVRSAKQACLGRYPLHFVGSFSTSRGVQNLVRLCASTAPTSEPAYLIEQVLEL